MSRHSELKNQVDAHPGDQVMTILSFALNHYKSHPDPFWSHQVLSGLPSPADMSGLPKVGASPPRLAYPSLSTWMTNQSCSHQDPLERALKYMGLRGSVGLKRIPPAQPAAVYGSADTQELCNNVCEWDFSLTFNA